MNSTIRFNACGSIDCLYTEAINLHTLGRLHIVRATDIRFSDESQQWVVRDANTDAALFAHTSRSACLHWEHLNLQQKASS